MKSLFVAALAACSLSLLPSSSSDVFICVSPTAKKYHFKKDCSGLQKCTHQIKEVTTEEAKKLGYTVCKIEK